MTKSGDTKKPSAPHETNPLVTGCGPGRPMSKTGGNDVINTDLPLWTEYYNSTTTNNNKSNTNITTNSKSNTITTTSNNNKNSDLERNDEDTVREPEDTINKTQKEEEEEEEEEGKKEKSGFKLLSLLSPRQKYTLSLITLAQILTSVASSMLGPFYPIEAAKKGVGLAATGVVIGLFDAVVFVTAPFFGNYLVKLGPRFVFIAGICVGGCCNILFGALHYCPPGAPFIVMSILVRSVEAVGFSAFLTSSFAIVSSEFKDNVGLCFGILESGSGLGYTLGPVIGGSLHELGGFGLPFYFAGIAVLLNVAALYRFLPRVEESDLPSSSSSRKGSMLSLLRSPMVAVPMGSVLVGMVGITAFDSTFARHVERIHVTAGTTGLMYGCLALVHCVMSVLYGYVSDWNNAQAPLIVGGHLVFGVGFFVIAPSGFLPFLKLDLVSIFVGLSLIGVSLGCALVPTIKCMVTGAMEMGFDNTTDTFALVSGLFNSVSRLGAVVGPVGVGYLAQVFGFSVAYTVVGMCSVFMMGVCVIVFLASRVLAARRTRRRAAYQRH